MEPFEYVSRGLDAWGAEDLARAERLLNQGVDAYRRAEPGGVDYALGRLGAFLLDRERIDEAAEVLDEAIALSTDIPVIWTTPSPSGRSGVTSLVSSTLRCDGMPALMGLTSRGTRFSLMHGVPTGRVTPNSR